MQKKPLDDYVDLLTRNGSIKQIAQYIKSNPEIKTNTPFIYAVHANRLDVVKLLIKLRAPINAQDKHLRTALHYAVAFNREPFIALLVNAGATLIPDKDGKTPLDMPSVTQNQKP